MFMKRADLRGEQVGVLVSGGLSSTAVAAWLAESGIRTICYVADVGQPGSLPARSAAKLLSDHGLQTRLVDLRAEMAAAGIGLVRQQATYEGGYWNTTGASREVLVAGLAGALAADGCTVLAHGCVGGGNDQARFARYATALCPRLRVFAPWTADWMLERFGDRASMASYLGSLGLPDEVTSLTRYSVDGNLTGCSHESSELESLRVSARSLMPLMTVWPQDAPDVSELFRVRFEGGRPARIGDRTVSATEAVSQANAIGGRNGISVRSVIENRTNGTKCRGVYEAPGLELLGRCIAFLYQASHDKPAARLMRLLSALLGESVYEGRLHDESSKAARAAADILAQAATGTVEVELYRGNVIFRSLDDLPDGPGTPRQTRFASGGHQWHTEVAQRLP